MKTFNVVNPDQLHVGDTVALHDRHVRVLGIEKLATEPNTEYRGRWHGYAAVYYAVKLTDVGTCFFWHDDFVSRAF